MDKVILETPLMTVGTLFKRFYIVPDYQREYVWNAHEQVEQLLEDIFGSFDIEGSNRKKYFLGSIVVSEQSHELYEVIDGQQRITTLYIILCAINDYFHAINKDSVALRDQIVATASNDFGEDVLRHRLELQYKDSSDILIRLAGSVKLPDSEAIVSVSVTNIQEAYTCIYDFLIEKFATNRPQDQEALVAGEANLRKFYAYLTKNVELICITTGDVARALWVFETINNRGVSLNSMDLFKNLLFREASPVAFDLLKAKWKTLIDILSGAKEKPLRFLRYFILANYDVNNYRLAEDEIFKWFRDNDRKCQYKKDPVAFVEQLLQSATAYASFAKSENKLGTKNCYLNNIRQLSRASRQHFLLLLAGRHLDVVDFNELCRNLENLIFTFIATRQQTNKLEILFAQAASELRKANNASEVTDVIEKHFKVAQLVLVDRFEDVFREFTDTTLQKYRVKYVLAKMTQFIDLEAGQTQFTTDLNNYLECVETEHILPQKPTLLARKQFDKPEEIETYIHSIGNLALLEKSHNASLKNNGFENKKKVYSHSNFLLTKLLSGPIKIGTNTSIDQAIKYIPTYDDWNSEAIEGRRKYLASLAREVWDMPRP